MNLKSNIQLSLITAGLISSGVSSIRAEVLGTYTFDDVVANAGGTVDPTPPPVYPGLSFGSFTANGLGSNPRSGGLWSFSGWSLGTQPDTGRYYEATITPEPGSVLNLDAMSFGVRRSSTGPRDFSVRSSLDNFEANLPAQIVPENPELSAAGGQFHFVNDNTSTQPANVNGSTVALGEAFDAVSGPVTFRIYGYGAEQAGGTLAIDEVAVSGSVSAVPEPEEYALLVAVSLAGVAGVRRYRLARRESAGSDLRIP